MRQLTPLDTRFRAQALGDLTAPVFVTALLGYLSSYQISLAQEALAFFLCWMPWTSYRRWLHGKRDSIPLFALLSSMFWLAYAVPLFWAQHVVTGVFGRRVLTEAFITQAMLLGVMGVVCLWLGIKVARISQWFPKVSRDVSSNPSKLTYLRVVFVFGTLVKVFVPINALGDGGRQILANFENIVPVVSFAVFVRHYLRGTLRTSDKILVFGYASVATIVGISSGWLGSAVNLGLVFIVIYVYEKRRFPLAAVLAVIPLILFFQPAKSMFRERYWARESTDTSTERVSYWVENSWRLWNDAISSHDNEQLRELSNSTLSRFDLLRQTAQVIEFTPSRVPYQYGSLYSYMAVTFIPRYFWPDKPSVNDANRWYQVRYGLTDPENLSVVSIAVGTVAESYINFGWFGPVLVIFPLGIFLGSFERIFLHSDSGVFFSCLGAVLLPQLLTIEAQMAQYVAGLVQQIGLVLLVLVPTLELRVQAKQFRPPVPFPYPNTAKIAKPNSVAANAPVLRPRALGK
jgi:O-antigen polysaccharide polymerase Wzy